MRRAWGCWALPASASISRVAAAAEAAISIADKDQCGGFAGWHSPSGAASAQYAWRETAKSANSRPQRRGKTHIPLLRERRERRQGGQKHHTEGLPSASNSAGALNTAHAGSERTRTVMLARNDGGSAGHTARSRGRRHRGRRRRGQRRHDGGRRRCEARRSLRLGSAMCTTTACPMRMCAVSICVLKHTGVFNTLCCVSCSAKCI